MKQKTKAGRVLLPAGFEAIQTGGNFAPTWDMKKNPVIQGVVVGIKELKKGGKIKNDTRILTIKQANGEEVSVWESASIRAVFDTAQEHGVNKCEVAFAYAGEKKIKGQRNPMHDISGGIKAIGRKRSK